MATYYIWSGATGAGNGTSWADAYTTLVLALASGKAAGDIFYLAHDHNESTGAAITPTIPGNNTNPCYFICVNRAGSVPPVQGDWTTGASIASAGNFGFTFAGTAGYNYWYGVRFRVGVGATSGQQFGAQSLNMHFKKCNFELGSSTGSFAGGSQNQAHWTLEETSIKVAAATSPWFWNVTSPFITFKDCQIMETGSVQLTSVINATQQGNFVFDNCDFSNMTAANLFLTTLQCRVLVRNCKKASGSAWGGGQGTDNSMISIVGSEEDTVAYSELTTIRGKTTVSPVYRTGGAEFDGTPYCWLCTPGSTGPNWNSPYELPPISFWNNTVGTPITVTMEVANTVSLDMTNQHFWLEVLYYGTAGSTLGSRANTGRANPLETAVALTTSTATWSNSPTKKFKVGVVFTPQEKGPITILPRAIVSSSQPFYVDPRPVIT